MADIRISDFNPLRFVQANKIGYNYATVDFQNRLYTVRSNPFIYFQKFGVEDVLALQMAVYDISGEFSAVAKLKNLLGEDVETLNVDINGVGDVTLIEIIKNLTEDYIGTLYVEVVTTDVTTVTDTDTATAISWYGDDGRAVLEFDSNTILGEINVGDSVTVIAILSGEDQDFNTTILEVFLHPITQLIYCKVDVQAVFFEDLSGSIKMTYDYDIVNTQSFAFISEPFEVDGANNCLSKFIYSDSKNYTYEEIFFSTGIEFQLRAETNANQLPQVDKTDYDDQRKQLTQLNSVFYDKVEIFSVNPLPVWLARKIKFALGLNECYYNRQLVTLKDNAEIDLVEDGLFVCTFKFQTQINELSLKSSTDISGFDNMTYPSGYEVTCSPFQPYCPGSDSAFEDWLADNPTSGTNTGDQVADGVTITGDGSVDNPFVAVGDGGVNELNVSMDARTHLTGVTLDANADIIDSLVTSNVTNSATSGTITLPKQTVTTLTTTLTNAHTLTLIPELPTVFTNRNYSEVVLTVGATAPSITWSAPSGITFTWAAPLGTPAGGLKINTKHKLFYDWESATSCLISRREL